MKKLIIWTLLLVFVIASFGQQRSSPKSMLTHADYLRKSRGQKKTAWILLAGGATFLAAGIVIPNGDVTGYSVYPARTTYKNDGIKAAFGLTGAACMLGSIPFFLASGKNKRKALTASVFMDSEQRQVLQFAKISYIAYPAVKMKIIL